jgi:hypothetical protein
MYLQQSPLRIPAWLDSHKKIEYRKLRLFMTVVNASLVKKPGSMSRGTKHVIMIQIVDIITLHA